jgi:hypothetical protein
MNFWTAKYLGLTHFTFVKEYYFKPRYLSWVFAVSMISGCFLIGCSPPNQTQIAGRYFRSYQGVTDAFYLDSNGTFKQDVVFTNGSNWSLSGSWKVINRVIQLDKCYLTFDDEKQSIIIPPQIVYICTFSFDGGKLIRTEVQPPWVKTITPIENTK